MERKYVNRLERDGKRRGRVAPNIDRSAINAGISAYKKGKLRYENPWVGSKARLWTRGWNKAHGFCEGCPRCLTGTKVVDNDSEGNDSNV
jgi:hypothetical protein